MKPLETNRQVLTWLCGFQSNESAGKWKRIAKVAFTLGVVVMHLSSVITGATFIFINKSIDLETTLYSLIHTLGSASMFYLAIATILLSRNLTAIFDGLSTIYKESK